MLGSKKRIPKNIFNTNIFRSETFHSDGFCIRTIFLTKNMCDVYGKQTRVAVIVSKKISKHATDRNKIRRRIYSIIELCYYDLKKGHMIVISTKKDIMSMSFRILSEKIKKTLKKAKLL